jgi:hypothetical protein
MERNQADILSRFHQRPDRRDPRSEREYYLNLFIQRLKAEREGDNELARKKNQELVRQGKKPIHPIFRQLENRTIVFKVSHLKTRPSRIFIISCEKADNFSRCFFGSLKVKK